MRLIGKKFLLPHNSPGPLKGSNYLQARLSAELLNRGVAGSNHESRTLVDASIRDNFWLPNKWVRLLGESNT